MDRYTGGRWLIYGPQNRTDNQSPSMKQRCNVLLDNVNTIKKAFFHGNEFNPVFSKKVQWQTIAWGGGV